MENIEIFEKVTKYTFLYTKKLGYWFVKQPIEVKMNVLKGQRNHYFKTKNSNQTINDNLVSAIAFFLAIDELYKIEKNIHTKNKTMKMERIMAQDYKEPRKREIRDKLLDRWQQIKIWRNSGKSSRKIAELIRSKYRFDVSHQYILDIWKEQEDVRF